jgi:hypothetical protein
VPCDGLHFSGRRGRDGDFAIAKLVATLDLKAMRFEPPEKMVSGGRKPPHILHDGPFVLWASTSQGYSSLSWESTDYVCMLSELLFDRTPAAKLKLGPFKANRSCFYYFSGVLTMCAILLQLPGKSRYGYREYTRIGMIWLAKVHTNKFQKSGIVATLVLI